MERLGYFVMVLYHSSNEIMLHLHPHSHVFVFAMAFVSSTKQAVKCRTFPAITHRADQYKASFLLTYVQLDCTLAVKALQTWVKEGKAPSWFRPLVIRTFLLGMFVAAIMFLRVTIMKAELPVFTV